MFGIGVGVLCSSVMPPSWRVGVCLASLVMYEFTTAVIAIIIDIAGSCVWFNCQSVVAIEVTSLRPISVVRMWEIWNSIRADSSFWRGGIPPCKGKLLNCSIQGFLLRKASLRESKCLYDVLVSSALSLLSLLLLSLTAITRMMLLVY